MHVKIWWFACSFDTRESRSSLSSSETRPNLTKLWSQFHHLLLCLHSFARKFNGVLARKEFEKTCNSCKNKEDFFFLPKCLISVVRWRLWTNLPECVNLKKICFTGWRINKEFDPFSRTILYPSSCHTFFCPGIQIPRRKETFYIRRLSSYFCCKSQIPPINLGSRNSTTTTHAAPNSKTWLEPDSYL